CRSSSTRHAPPDGSDPATSSVSRRSAPACTGARRCCARESRAMTPPPVRARGHEPEGLPGWLVVALLVTGLAIAIVAALSMRRENRAARAEWGARLDRAADDRLTLAETAVRRWREHAHLLGRLDAVRSAAHGGSARSADAARSALAESARGEE